LKKAEAGKFKESKATTLRREIGDIVNADLLQEKKQLEKEIFENACRIETLQQESKQLSNQIESLQDSLYNALNDSIKLYVEQHGEGKLISFENRFGELDEFASFQEKLDYFIKLSSYLR
jgi:hypothetical protein